MSRNKRVILFLFGLGVGAACLWFIFSQIQLAEVRHDLFDHARFSLALPFIVIYALFFWLKAMRWRLLLLPITPISTRDLLSPILIGYAGNLLFPAQLGEIVRSYLLGNRLRAHNSPILATILIERMFDVLTLLLLVVWMLASASQKEFPSLQTLSYVAAGVVTITFMLLILGLRYLDWFLAFCQYILRLLPRHAGNYLLLQIERSVKGLESVRRPRLLAGIVISSLLMWLVMAAAVYIVLVALNIDTPFSAAVIVLVFTVIGFALPAMPGYVGTVQVSFLLALLPYGVDPDLAVAASIFYHVLITFPPLLIAGFFALRLKTSPLMVLKPAEARVESQTATDRPGR